MALLNSSVLRWTALVVIAFRLKSFFLCILFKGICLFVNMRGFYGPVKRLPFGLVLKSGKLGAAEEAKTIQFIQKNTQIPVPRVILSATGIWNNYMLMEYVDGELLHFAWRGLSQAQRAHVVEQLRFIVRQLRSLPAPQPPAVSALNNTPCLDGRVASNRTFGPFTSVAAFHDHLIDVSKFYMDEHDLRHIRSQMSDQHHIVFTHGDLAPRNIFVKGDRIVAVIDWEHAGWYPEYWEYTKAKFCHNLDEAWDKAITEMIPQDYERDWRLDKQLSDRIVGPI